MDLNLTLGFLKALRDFRVRYVLVGGLAMVAHGRVRATLDADIFVDASDRNIESLRHALASVIDDPSIDEITAEDLQGEYPAVRYVSPDGSLTVDIIARLGDAFDYHGLSSEEATLEATPVTVATAETLLKMKQGTLRDVDRLDAAWLRAYLASGKKVD